MGTPLGFPASFSGPFSSDLANYHIIPKANTPQTPCGVNSASGSASCPLEMCCSKDGYCANTPEYCGTGCQSAVGPCTVRPRPDCSGASNKATASKGRSVGYYSGSNVYIRPCDVVRPRDIPNMDRYTHLYYTFANINPDSFAVELRPQDNETLVREFTALGKKKKNSTSSTTGGLQTWIAVGGGGFSATGSSTATTWSDMVSTDENRKAFITSLVDFMDEYSFQGVDLDWEYPGSAANGGLSQDTEKLVRLVKDMRSVFGDKYGVSMVIPPDKSYLVNYDLVAMEPYVDSFGFMAYDLHVASPEGGKVQAHADIREIRDTMTPLWSAGIDPAKINLGLPYYGRGFTLTNKTCSDLDCSYKGPSVPGNCAQSSGIMMLSEIQDLLDEGTAKSSTIPNVMMKKLTWSNQWVAYDDEETMKQKTAWADETCLGGVMYWSVDQDVRS
ncbi:glycoside hydrolase superfamily [Microdochium bolleyi]|uniref:chitinase n=1 Tax=Microdochium bolleyi TaxID=196109 RepID=A0A136IKT6_9PEZI|nr:glycoside hydrolase superfamily [Microdochium bolleyi]